MTIFQAVHDSNDYQAYLNHKTISEEEMHTDVKVKYKAKLYTLNAAVNRGLHFKITTELHIDQ